MRFLHATANLERWITAQTENYANCRLSDHDLLWMIGPKKMVWFPLHAPEKVGTEGEKFFLLNIFICKFCDLFYDPDEKVFDDPFLLHSRLLALCIQQIQQSTTTHPPIIGRSHTPNNENF
jgi:hypothetical protein